jgi:hypothetical protein
MLRIGPSDPRPARTWVGALREAGGEFTPLCYARVREAVRAQMPGVPGSRLLRRAKESIKGVNALHSGLT